MKGFLPTTNPIKEYKEKTSPSLKRLRGIAANLPKLLLTSKVSKTIESLNKDDLNLEDLFIDSSDPAL